MPAKTVIFTSVRKFDGEQNRYIISSRVDGSREENTSR